MTMPDNEIMYQRYGRNPHKYGRPESGAADKIKPGNNGVDKYGRAIPCHRCG